MSRGQLGFYSLLRPESLVVTSRQNLFSTAEKMTVYRWAHSSLEMRECTMLEVVGVFSNSSDVVKDLRFEVKDYP